MVLAILGVVCVCANERARWCLTVLNFTQRVYVIKHMSLVTCLEWSVLLVDFSFSLSLLICWCWSETVYRTVRIYHCSHTRTHFFRLHRLIIKLNFCPHTRKKLGCFELILNAFGWLAGWLTWNLCCRYLVLFCFVWFTFWVTLNAIHFIPDVACLVASSLSLSLFFYFVSLSVRYFSSVYLI